MKKVSLFPKLLYSDKTAFDKVMIIDDDEICHTIMSKNVELSGFARKAVAFDCAKEALNELRDCYAGIITFPDIIFLDINMPGMSGWEFMKEYEKLPQNYLRSTKIVMLSSSNSPIDMERASDNCFIYDYIEKPISICKLELIAQKIILSLGGEGMHYDISGIKKEYFALKTFLKKN